MTIFSYQTQPEMRQRDLAVQAFVSQVQHTLIDAYLRSGMTLEAFAQQMEMEPDDAYQALMDTSKHSLRFISEAIYVCTGEKVEIAFN